MSNRQSDIAQNSIRFGLLELYAASIFMALPRELSSSFTVKCAGSPTLVKAMTERELDIVCLFEPPPSLAGDALTWREDIVWVRSVHFSPPDNLPLPVIGTDACVVHQAAIKTLEQRNIAYRVVFEGSISLKIAAAKEGLGLLAMPRWALPPYLVTADEFDLPAVPPPTAAICFRDGFHVPEPIRAALAAIAAQFGNQPAQQPPQAGLYVPKLGR